MRMPQPPAPPRLTDTSCPSAASDHSALSLAHPAVVAAEGLGDDVEEREIGLRHLFLPDVVAELHGNVRESHCVDCGSTWDTEEILVRVAAGDIDPDCPDCGGMVKTATVMFGELLPEREMIKAMGFLAMSDAVLVLGSTVAVWPASDVVMRGALRSLPIVVVNKGATEADNLAAVKLDAAIGEVLPEIVDGVLASSGR